MEFNAAQFLQQSTAEANSTKIPNIPADEYIGQIQEPKPEHFVSGEKDGKPWTIFEYYVKIEDPRLEKALGRSVGTVRGNFFLELTDQGALKMGEGVNVQLGRLREACGLNVPGMPFSFAQFAGKMVKVKVGQRPDKNDPTTLYDEVKMVTKAF